MNLPLFIGCWKGPDWVNLSRVRPLPRRKSHDLPMKFASLLIWIAVVFLGVSVVHGQVQPGPLFTVSTILDRNNPTAKVGDCSLREALSAASRSGQAAVIVFAPKLEGNISLTLGQLNLQSPVSILGLGARKLSVTGGGGRVFAVSHPGPHLISGLTIKGGKLTSTFSAPTGGAGILNDGTLVIKDCAITDNQVTGAVRYAAEGGGIYNKGDLTLIRSTISGNSATGGPASDLYGYDGLGGGVFNDGSLVAEQCTFYNNTGTGGQGTSRNGKACGAIYNLGNLTLRGCTVTGNKGAGGAPSGGGSSTGVGGVWKMEGSCGVFSTIIAGNTATGYGAYRDVWGSFSSQGYNLVGALTGKPNLESAPNPGFGEATDQTGTDSSPRNPLLGTFQNNGGPTDTLLPAANSPALDKGKRYSEGGDQRGMRRVYDHPAIANASLGGGVDVGAVEYFPAGTNGNYSATITFENGAARIALKGEPGVRYRLQFSDDLIVPFFNLGTAIILADGLGALEFFDPGPLPPKRFYRAIPVP